MKRKGFTIIEVLIVVAIVGILSSIVLVNLDDAREKAEIAKTIQLVKEVEKAILLYHEDTGQYPPKCIAVYSPNNTSPCTAADDPLSNPLGVSGWNGPYIDIFSLKHGWGGDIGISNDLDFFGDGNLDGVILLNDDINDSNDNGGQISIEAITRIDEILDDGNLTTGEIRSGINGFCVANEVCIRYYDGL